MNQLVRVFFKMRVTLNGMYRTSFTSKFEARLLPQSGEPVFPDTPLAPVLLLCRQTVSA